MICEKCRSEISDAAKFCPKCGTPAPKPKVVKSVVASAQVNKCPSCGAENPLSAKFCRVDGHVLSSADALKEPTPDGGQSSDSLICHVCGTENAPAAKFCKKDGTLLLEGERTSGVAAVQKKETLPSAPSTITPVAVPDSISSQGELICPTCCTSNLPTAKFCRKDGTPLQGKQFEDKSPVMPIVDQRKPDGALSSAEYSPWAETVPKGSGEQEPTVSEHATSENRSHPPTQLGKDAGNYLESEAMNVGDFSKDETGNDKSVVDGTLEEVRPAAQLVDAKIELNCPVCGTINPITAKFCKKDGAPLQGKVIDTEHNAQAEASCLSKTINAASATTPPVSQYHEPKKDGSRKWLWVSIIMIVLLAGGGAGCYYYFNFYKQPTEQIVKKESPSQPPAIVPETQPGESGLKPETEPPVNPPGVNQTEVAPGTGANAAALVTPPAAPTTPDSGDLQKRLNKALKSKGIKGIYGEVTPDFVATLEGMARNQNQKVAALMIARSIQGITEVKSRIQIEKAPVAVEPSRAADPTKLEGELNRALRNQGLSGVIAVVSDNYDVKLKGSVGSSYEKEQAILVARNFNGVNRVKDMIFVVE